VFEIAFVLVIVVLVLGLGAVAMAGATAGRLTEEERGARMVAVLAIIGALVAGFGVILFFASNWNEIARPLRVAILLAGEVALFGAGFYLREVRGAYPQVGHALIFLGTLLFGASLFLVGQMYHVQAHDPLGFLIWSVAALLVAIVIRSGPLIALAILSFIAWLVHELIALEELTEVDAALVGPTLFVLVGTALYGFGTGASRWLESVRATRPMRMLGFATLALGTFALTFRIVHEQEIDRAAAPGAVKLLLWSLAAAAFAGAAALMLRVNTRRTTIPEALVLAATSVLALLAVFAPEFEPEAGGDEPTLYPVLFNAALAVLALGAIVAGLTNDEVWLANAGVAWVAIDVVARFLDPEWSMLQRATVFVAVGALAIAAAFALERRRALIVVRE
jgi:uncharacterized membrane protein